jgi:hypothetical protein
MPYVQRDPDTLAIIGLFANPQAGYAIEFLADNIAEVIAFRGPPSVALAQKLAAGIAVVSTGTPALNSTYALDQITLDQIRALATDAKAGLGFPGGESTFAYPDKDGVPRTFDATSMVDLYKALRDYVFGLNSTAAVKAAGGNAEWPEASATIA